GSQNFFFLAYPLWNGLPDVGTEAPRGPGEVPCASLAVGGAEFVPDGIITLADVLCDTWTMLPELTGTELASVQYVDPTDCSWQALALSRTPFFGASFGGALGVELASIREQGLLLQFTQSVAGVNRPVIVGSHDPSYIGRELSDAVTCGRAIINPHYHSLYESTTEIFCGLEGVDWLDVDVDGNPDDCEGGVYGGSGEQYALQTYVNRPGDFGFRAAVLSDFLGFIVLPSAPIPLQPGHAYLLSMGRAASPQTFIQPHY
ncbi:MAG: hypothetical protein AAF533_29890, partial [Acidobacteriota bacterium]